MPSAPAPRPTAPRRSASTDDVFDRLLADILGGTYPPRARLPAERTLARLLGASRPTVRAALAKLVQWHVIAARRGSGAWVRDMREWTIEVLPAYLRHGAPAADPSALARTVCDVLELRRRLVLDCLRVVAARIPCCRLTVARDALHHAWRSRHDPHAFAADDLAVVRAIIDAAGFLPGLWLLNRLSEIYLAIARTLTGVLGPPPDYVDAHERLLDALERGDHDTALATLDTYLQRHDTRLLAAFGAS